jgi:hypothetical protein
VSTSHTYFCICLAPILLVFFDAKISIRCAFLWRHYKKWHKKFKGADLHSTPEAVQSQKRTTKEAHTLDIRMWAFALTDAFLTDNFGRFRYVSRRQTLVIPMSYFGGKFRNYIGFSQTYFWKIMTCFISRCKDNIWRVPFLRDDKKINGLRVKL